MAEILRTYDWSFTSKHTTTARSREYPWDEWLDGRIRRLVRGEDFDNPATSVERVIRTSANRKGIKVRVRVESEDTIILQAHTDNARTMERGITRSPSKASIEAAKAAGNGAVPTKTVTRKRALRTEKPSVNGNAAKVPTKATKAAPKAKPARRAMVKAGA